MNNANKIYSVAKGLQDEGKLDINEFNRVLIAIISGTHYDIGLPKVDEDEDEDENLESADENTLMHLWLMANCDLSLEQMDTLGLFGNHEIDGVDGNIFLRCMDKKNLSFKILLSFATQGKKQVPCSLKTLDIIIKIRPSIVRRLWKFIINEYLPRIRERCTEAQETAATTDEDHRYIQYTIRKNSIILSDFNSAWIGRLLRTNLIPWKQVYRAHDNTQYLPRTKTFHDAFGWNEPHLHNDMGRFAGSPSTWLLGAPIGHFPKSYDQRMKILEDAVMTYARDVSSGYRRQSFWASFADDLVAFLQNNHDQLAGMLHWLIRSHRPWNAPQELEDLSGKPNPVALEFRFGRDQSLADYMQDQLFRKGILMGLHPDMIISLSSRTWDETLAQVFYDQYDQGKVGLQKAILFLMSTKKPHSVVKDLGNLESFALKIGTNLNCPDKQIVRLAERYSSLSDRALQILLWKLADIGEITQSVG